MIRTTGVKYQYLKPFTPEPCSRAEKLIEHKANRDTNKSWTHRENYEGLEKRREISCKAHVFMSVAKTLRQAGDSSLCSSKSSGFWYWSKQVQIPVVFLRSLFEWYFKDIYEPFILPVLR